MFERSASGQNNRALFYGVEYTCYVEGGSDTHDRSIDALFWEAILSTYRPQDKFAFLPRGGKPILEALAHQIITENIGNTIVAMDTDYDAVLGHRIADHRVLYTSGYSWENDVLDKSFLPSLARTLGRKASLAVPIRAKILAGYDCFAQGARLAIRADLLALINKSSVLPREAPGRVVKAGAGDGLPVFDNVELLKLVKEANKRTRPRSASAAPAIAPGLQSLVGHILSHGIVLLLRSVLRDMGGRKQTSPDHLHDVAIALLGNHLRSNGITAVAIHHQQQCAAIP